MAPEFTSPCVSQKAGPGGLEADPNSLQPVTAPGRQPIERHLTADAVLMALRTFTLGGNDTSLVIPIFSTT